MQNKPWNIIIILREVKTIYAKLFTSLYQGTLRGCSDELLVFTNLLAHADSAGIVDKHWRAIAEETGISQKRVKAAINTLEAPDPESRSPEMEGRRLVPVDEHRLWGWQIVNYAKYRSIRNEDDRREQNRLAQQKWRDKQKISGVSPVSQDKPKQKQEEEAEERREDAAVPLAVFLGMVESGLSERLGITTLPNQRLWHQKLTWAFQNNFTAAAVLECYDLLKAQEFWQTRSISAKTLIENLAHLPALRAGSGKGRTIETIPTADQIRADEQANDAARRPPPKPIAAEVVQ